MKAIRDKIRAITEKRRHLVLSLKELIAGINPVLRGWGNYFKIRDSSRKLQVIDEYVLERLYLFLSKKHGRSGRGWVYRRRHVNFPQEGLHQLSGTVRWHHYPAHALG